MSPLFSVRAFAETTSSPFFLSPIYLVEHYMDDEALDVHEGATSAPGHIRRIPRL